MGSKWLYLTKYNSDGSFQWLKACLVAQGFTQIPGLDFAHTFSPVAKAATICIILSITIMHKCSFHQLDVNNSFLTIISLPPFLCSYHLIRQWQFCWLHLSSKKALYGLKQTPHAWFEHLSTFLVSLGFSCSRADTSLFVFKCKSQVLYLLVYVDDIILTGNDSQLICAFITKIHAEFSIKDRGWLNYF